MQRADDPLFATRVASFAFAGIPAGDASRAAIVVATTNLGGAILG